MAGAAAGLPAADELLARCAERWPAFALLLLRWPGEAAPPPPAGPRLDRLRALVAAGRDPRYAAAEAGREAPSGPVPEPARPAGPPAVRPTRLPVPKQGQTHGTL
ncbi:hypothetical protein ACIGZJ_35880 [Kitasatospora sp. NPDC052868]|uniref:hypothetical protein n=1 Tax=Kitasatospora sp. NPDC052868 TaxID=3364060 RepID=UPI0037CA0FE6